MDRQEEILEEAGEPSSSSDVLSEGQLIQSSTERSETILSVKGLIMKRPSEMPPFQDVNHIRRIPPTLVKEKPEAYIPHLVSIGPFHRNKPHLQFMESRKTWYLENFLKENPKAELDEYIEAMIDLEERVRGFYQEAENDELKIDKESFVMMLLVDGCFILQQLKYPSKKTMSHKKWGFVVSLDLLLLENQLPFYVLEELYLVSNRRSDDTLTIQPYENSYVWRILELLVGNDVRTYCYPMGSNREFQKPSHLLDYLRQILIPQSCGWQGNDQRKEAASYENGWQRKSVFNFFPERKQPVMKMVGERKSVFNFFCERKHIYENGRRKKVSFQFFPRKKAANCENGRRKEADSYVTACIPCVRDLRRANVKFVKNNHPKNLLDIKFDNTKGVLEIPGLRIDCGTEMIIRNLIAYEQYTDDYSFITEYAAFFDGLIDSSKDVELLQKSGIIEIILGDPNDVSRLFNNLLKDVAVPFYYTVNVRCQVVRFCKKKRNKWMAILKLDYFNSPWAFISVVAAIILLTTAVVQTLFTILSYFHS